MAESSSESLVEEPGPHGWSKVQDALSLQRIELLDRRWTRALDNMLMQQLADARKSLNASGISGGTESQLNGTRPSHWKRRVNQVALKILQYRDFELTIIILICLNCFVLALYTPLEPGSIWNVLMNRVDAVLNVAFTLEAIVRILALGSLWQYFASPWNAFDAFIVSMGYLSYIDLGQQATGVRALRGLRALRPLRTMRAFKPLRIVVDCFFAAAPLMSSVIALIFFFIFITGLVGMQIFADAYHHHCVSLETGQPEFYNPTEAAAWGCGAARACPVGFQCMYHADPPFYEYRVAGFDNVGAAMLTAFQISTIAGWSAVFYRTWDSTGVWCLFYHLAIIVFVAYILVNCFLAGLKLKFAAASHDAFAQETTEEPHKDNSLVLLGKAVVAYYKRRQDQTLERTEKSKPRFQQILAAIADHPWFTRTFMALILVNTVAMAIEHDGMSDSLQERLTALNTYLTYAFAVEVVVKMIGQGLAGFFSEGFNIFDFFVVVLAFVELIMVSRSGDGGSLSALRSFKTLRILKSFRVLRMLRMFRYVDSLRALGEVMMDSMESFLSVSFLCFLFLMVFAIIGLHTMGDIVMDAPNFNTFYASFLTVFQILTLENWEEIMFSTIQTSGMLSVCLFFVIWVLIGKFVLLSLFLAVILEAFEVAHERQVAEKMQQQESLLLGMPETDDSHEPLRVLQPIPTFNKILDLFKSVFGSPAVHPAPAHATADAGAADSNDISDTARVTVPAFSQSQMEAAKSVQHSSMLAYSMQMSGLRVPAQELATIARQLSPARSLQGGVRTPRVLGIVQSLSGPMVLSLVIGMTSSGDDGKHDAGPVSAERMLSLSAVPLGESRSFTNSTSIHALQPSTSSSSGSYRSQDGENGLASQLASRATGWANSSTPMARMVNFHTAERSEREPEVAAQASAGIFVDTLQRVSSATFDDPAFLPVTRRVQIQAPEVLSNLESIDSLNADPGQFILHGQDKEGGEKPSEVGPSIDTLTPACPTAGSHSAAPHSRIGSIQFLQQAAKNRQSRRLDSLKKVMSASADALGHVRERDMNYELPSQPSINASGTIVLSDVVSQPVLDKEHDWLMGDPEALSAALKNNPIFSIIAQETYRGSDNGSVPSDCSSLKPDDFLISEFIDKATCFGPSGKEKEDEDPVEEVVLGLHADHPARALATRIVLHWAFDYTMTAAIILSCGAMTLERPSLQPDSRLFGILTNMNLVLNILFGVELILKLATYGFQTYWSRTSNKIDAAIVLLSFLLMAVEDSGLSIFRSLRSLRAIKVLRVATRSDGLRNIISLIINSLASMLNVTLLLVMFVCIFAILGVQLFSGLMYSCNDQAVPGVDECIGTFLDESGAEVDRAWTRPFLNFDNLGRALLTLFVCSSLDGWAPVSQAATAAPLTKGRQPQPGSNDMAALYFVGYIVCISFIVLQLYVGVLFYSFNKIQTEKLGLHSLDISQKEWLSIVPYLCSLKYVRVPPYPTGKWKQRLYDIATSNRLEQIVLVAVFLNVVELCVWWHAMPDEILSIKERLNLVFSLCFLAEMFIKIGGTGWREYWANGWNKLDFSLVCLSVVDLAFSYLQSSFLRIIKVLKAQKLLKLLRLSRMVKALKTMKSIFHLLIAIQRSLISITQVGALMLVTFFVFAYVGVLLFGSVKQGSELNAHANFETFGAAMVTLVRLATNDNWAAVQADANVLPPACDKAAGNCGQPFWIVAMYFVVFISLQSILLINLFSTIILHHFEALQGEESWCFNPEQIDLLIQIWGHVSRMDGTISHYQLIKLLRSLLPPLGVGPGATPEDANKYIKSLGIVQVLGKRYTFEHTTFALIASVAEVPLPPNEATETMKQTVRTRFAKVYRKLGLAPQSIVSQKIQQISHRVRAIVFGKPLLCPSDGDTTTVSDVRSHSIFTHDSLRKDVLQSSK